MSTIEWTASQLAEIERQKAANPPNRRLSIEFTLEQREAWRKAVEEEEANKEATIAHHRRIVAAAAMPGFFGDLRRAINASGHRVITLPEEIGIDARLLDDFRAGEADLSPNAIARLVDALGLRLMQEIPPAVNPLDIKNTHYEASA